MRKMLWVLCGFALAAPTYAAPDAGCMKNREMVLKAASERECPEEEAEAKAMTCEGSAIKDAKRLYVLIKSCHDKPKKGGAASSGAKATRPAEKKAVTDSGAVELPEGKFKYRALDAEGAVIAVAGSDKSGADALGAAKEKVKAVKCEGSETIKITLQSYKDDGSWTKGISSDVKCKK